MYYLVNADCNGMAAHLSVKGFKQFCVSDAMDMTNIYAVEWQ